MNRHGGGESYVDHEVLKAFAKNKVNVPKEEAKERRHQVDYLRERLEDYIAAHPDFDLVKLRASGSTAKHTAIRRRRGTGSDADVAAYLRVGDPGIDVSTVLAWLEERCEEIYGKTKVAEDFKPSDHAVGITMRGSSLKIDVVPVLYTGEPDDRGYLVPSGGGKVLTAVTLHLRFIEKRKGEAGDGYRELIRRWGYRQTAPRVGGVREHSVGEVLVTAARPGVLAGLPAHDRVNDRVQDAKYQQDGHRRVTGVVETARRRSRDDPSSRPTPNTPGLAASPVQHPRPRNADAAPAEVSRRWLSSGR